MVTYFHQPARRTSAPTKQPHTIYKVLLTNWTKDVWWFLRGDCGTLRVNEGDASLSHLHQGRCSQHLRYPSATKHSWLPTAPLSEAEVLGKCVRTARTQMASGSGFARVDPVLSHDVYDVEKFPSLNTIWIDRTYSKLFFLLASVLNLIPEVTLSLACEAYLKHPIRTGHDMPRHAMTCHDIPEMSLVSTQVALPQWSWQSACPWSVRRREIQWPGATWTRC